MVISRPSIMDISVVVPIYNTASYIEYCIDALESQDYPHNSYEIIMIDNNSTDGSDAIVTRHPSIKLLREARQGSYAARNRGLSEAAAPITAFTDSDCAPEQGWLRRIMDGMRNS